MDRKLNPRYNNYTFIQAIIKAIFIGCLIATTSILSSCTPQNNEGHSNLLESLNWATADRRAIKDAISQILLQKTPYPDDIYFDSNALYNELRSLKQKLKRAENSCGDQSNSKNSFSIRDGSELKTNPRCKSISLNTKLIESLNIQIENQNDIIAKRKVFDMHINDQANTEVSFAIKSYARNRYRLVLESKSRNILYNQEGVFIDITDAVIENYREHSLK